MHQTTNPDITYFDVAATAKVIRAELRAAFPGVKFSVRSRRDAGANAIGIVWTDGPRAETVDDAVARYTAGGFDGSTDMYHYAEPDLVAVTAGELPQWVQYGAEYIRTDRAQSPEAMAWLIDRLEADNPDLRFEDRDQPWGQIVARLNPLTVGDYTAHDAYRSGELIHQLFAQTVFTDGVGEVRREDY